MKKTILSLVAVGLSLTLLGCPPPEGEDSGKTDGETTKPADGDDGEAGDGGETDGGEAAGGGDPDISHVKAGQDYVFESKAGGVTSKMIYRVKDVTDGVITYETVMVVDMGGEMKEMPGAEAKWPMKVEGEATGEAPKVESKDLGEEKIKVGDMEFTCKVTETETSGMKSKVWVPMKPAGVMTFPPMIKSETTGAAESMMTLIEIKE